jgi:hypothetical protein
MLQITLQPEKMLIRLGAIPFPINPELFAEFPGLFIGEMLFDVHKFSSCKAELNL